MNQSSVMSSQDVVKAPPTLDKIPEDVQLAIIKFIQFWKRSEGTEQEREMGKRARDSSLRAVALSCRNLLSIYQPRLLSDVTVNNMSIMRLFLALARNPDSGKWVRSITFARRDVDPTQEEKAEVEKDLPEMSKALRAQGVRFEQVMTVGLIMEAVYQLLPCIQTLTIRRPQFKIPLQSKLANQRLAPLPFLTHSLKKLFIPLWDDIESNFKARNVVWVLVFCTGLRSASLPCIFDKNDFKYLADFTDTFSGLSKVVKLSLGRDFSATEALKRYWDAGVGKQWIGGNRKSQAMFYLLKVTKNLQCLELNTQSSRVGSESFVNSRFLSALGSSFESLEHLRLFGLGLLPEDAEEYQTGIDFSVFVRLKVISIDGATILRLERILEIKFPSGIKVICLPYYYGQWSFQEDLELARILEIRSFPSLETIVLPSKPILRNSAGSGSDEFNKLWLEGRRELEKAKVFTSGKVELRFVEPGQFIGESSETDFMSTLMWLSPP